MFVQDFLIQESGKIHEDIITHRIVFLDTYDKVRCFFALKVLYHLIHLFLILVDIAYYSGQSKTGLVLIPYSDEVFIVCFIEFIYGSCQVYGYT